MDDIRPSTTNSEHAIALPHLQVIRRSGDVVAFNLDKISIALSKAFLAVEGNLSATSQRIRDEVTILSQHVNNALMRRLPTGGSIHIEDIQDQVELALMRNGNHDVARAYVLYRERRNAERLAQQVPLTEQATQTINVKLNGKLQK